MRLLHVLAALLCAFASSFAHAQDGATPPGTDTPPKPSANESKAALDAELRERALELGARLANLGDVGGVAESTPKGRIARLLEDLHVQFKTFESGSDGDAELGFSYELAKSLLRSTDSNAWSLDFAARGNVAFDREVNPDDFLSTQMRVRWFGTTAIGDGAGGARAGATNELAGAHLEQLAAFDPDTFANVATRLAHEPSADVVRKDPEYQALVSRYLEDVESKLPPELVWNANVHVELESNQDFSSRELAYGAAFGGRIVSWNPDAALSQLNVFDFPGAALRWLSGQTDDFRPSGEAWPSVVAGLDLVDAADSEIRRALDEDDTYLRARLEAGMKTRVLNLDGEALFLSAGWRFYQEVDAPASVRRADIDRASHVEVKLDLPNGWALTYAAGKLPLDAEEDSTFALGFNVQF